LSYKYLTSSPPRYGLFLTARFVNTSFLLFNRGPPHSPSHPPHPRPSPLIAPPRPPLTIVTALTLPGTTAYLSWLRVNKCCHHGDTPIQNNTDDFVYVEWIGGKSQRQLRHPRKASHAPAPRAFSPIDPSSLFFSLYRPSLPISTFSNSANTFCRSEDKV
jgi:hypothetical protein